MASDEVLYISIGDGPPELDFLFALARGKRLSLTLCNEYGKREVNVYIDGISVYEPSYLEHPHHWNITGHFWGNGKNSWSGFPGPNKKSYYLWGKFKGNYDKRTRVGFIETKNFSTDYPLSPKR